MANAVAAESEGLWIFPSQRSNLDRRLVLGNLTGGQLFDEVEEAGLWPRRADGEIRRITFSPTEFSEMDRETIERNFDFQISEAANHFQSLASLYLAHFDLSNVWIESFGPHDPTSIKTQKIVEHITRLFRICSTDVARELDRLRSYRLSDSDQEKIGAVVAAYSVWQFVRVLTWINWLTRSLQTKIVECGRMTDEILTFIENQPFDIRLIVTRIAHNRWGFRLDSSSWVAPFRVRAVPSGSELTIFQILPNWEILEVARRPTLRCRQVE